jgi:Mor family transcriptional regulator
MTPEQRREAIKRRARGATLHELARSYNVSTSTISRLSE